MSPTAVEDRRSGRGRGCELCRVRPEDGHVVLRVNEITEPLVGQYEHAVRPKGLRLGEPASPSSR